MKERFEFGSSNRTSGRRWLLLITLIAIIILFLDLAGRGMLRSYARTAAAHFWTSGSAGEAAIEQTGFFATHSALAHENASLRAQVLQYQNNASANAILSEQNAQLRALVHLAGSTPGTAAAVVSSFLASPYGTFLISAHAPDVAAGDLVLSDGGFVIGRVREASGSTSLVSEVFASDASVEGLISGADVTIDGYGGGNARAAAPRDAHISVGDVVIIPSLGARPAGVVGSVESSAASADQKIYIRLPVNLSSLRYVYVVPGQ